MRAVVLAGCLGLLAPAAIPEWHIDLVDDTSEVAGTAIAVWQGVPHVAYYNDSGLQYAWYEDGMWQHEVVDPRTAVHNRGPSLIFDETGAAHVGFTCGTPCHAYRATAGWVVEAIDVDPGGDYISICFDPAGQLHAAYNHPVGLFSSQLKYAWRDGTGWHAELVTSDGGYDCVLRFDGLGRPCIVHCGSWSAGEIFCSVRTGTGWTHETVLPGSASQSFMTMDASGNPRVSYYWTQSGSYDLRYAERIGSDWRFDLVDHGEQTYKRGWDNCIARAEDGSYHISYHAHNELQLRYARGSYGHWNIEVVDTVGMWSLFSAIALDDAGRPYIAYCDEDEGRALFVATQTDMTGIDVGAVAGAEFLRLELWPNPCREVLGIRALGPRAESPRPSPAVITVRDVTGRCVRDVALGVSAQG
ncbi:MAG: hypothetical protein FJY75_05515, partial [Candidatus Eisenbacteria bacterium]|nr:hypothetical protein [Candidatus Eisenbacteria bacterium]